MSEKETIYSFSRLDWNCLYSWKKRYIDNDKGESNAWSDGGSFCHELVEAVAKGEETEANTAELFRDNWHDSLQSDFPNFNIDLKEHYYKKIQPFFDRNKYWYGKVNNVEEHLVFELPNGKKFQGFIDLELENRKGLCLIDHKISKRFDNDQLLKKQRQLYIYAFGYHQLHGKYPDLLIFNFFQEPTNPITIKFNKHYMDEAINWAMKQIKTIEDCIELDKISDVFFPDVEKLTEKDGRRDMFCANLCNHRNNCPYVEGEFFKK